MAAKESYIEGTTSSGFCYKIEKEALDDWELIEQISEMGEVSSSIVVMKAVLGEEQYAALKEHCRSPKGRIRASQMEKEIVEILNSNNPVKK